VISNNESRQPANPVNRGWPAVLGAVVIFAVLSMLPTILPALHLHLQPTAPTTSYGVTLIVAPREPRSVHLPAVARPIDPGLPPATLPAVDPSREAATVSAEDKRLRTMLHQAARVYQPEVVPSRGSLPTLVLTAGQGSYTADTLAQYGALVMLPNDAALLVDNVYVSTNASLTLGGPNMRVLYLDSGSGGFATIVGWGGNLTFAGTAKHAMTIMGWDRSTNSPAADQGYGRSYIREAGGRMTLTNVRVSSLGFWSGRTGGVAWTGLTGKPSTGGATASTFTNDTYGAFVSRGYGVTFKNDLFEFNQLDGLHIHRYSVNSAIVSSSAARNGGNGFVVSPATQGTQMRADVAEHNAGNGFFLNGRPLATGASASGGAVTPGIGTALEYSAALSNERIGILVEGGLGTVLKGDQVCAGITAIVVRDGATDTVVTGNTVRCNPRSGFSIGPSAPGAVLSGNAVNGSRTAFLIRDAGPVRLDKNLVTNAIVFGISARGATSSVSGVGNTIAGSGFRAVDSRADAPAPSLYGTNLSGWVYHARITFWTYLQFHPLAAMWLGILILVIVAWVWSRRRRLPSHPYPASTRWRGEVEAAEIVTAVGQFEPVAAGTRTPATAEMTALSELAASADRKRPASPAPSPVFHPKASPAPSPVFRPKASPAAADGLHTPAAAGTPDGFRAPAGAEPSGNFRAPASFGTRTDAGMPGEADDPQETPMPAARSASRGQTHSRPPWATAPMPKLDEETGGRDQISLFAPPRNRREKADPE